MNVDGKVVKISYAVGQEILRCFDFEKYDIFIDINTRKVTASEKNTIVDTTIPLETHCVLPDKLVVLPTPYWVVNTDQKYYVCFASEVPELIKQFWKVYLEHS